VAFPVGLTEETVDRVVELEETVLMMMEEEDAEVMLAEEVDTADAEYAVPVLRVMVLVDRTLVPEADELELLEEEPVMWKGKEYWKMVGSESRDSLNP